MTLPVSNPSFQPDNQIVDNETRKGLPVGFDYDEPPRCLRPPWHPNCYWPKCKCAEMTLADS